jgi:hypothetical protein
MKIKIVDCVLIKIKKFFRTHSYSERFWRIELSFLLSSFLFPLSSFGKRFLNEKRKKKIMMIVVHMGFSFKNLNIRYDMHKFISLVLNEFLRHPSNASHTLLLDLKKFSPLLLI